MCIRDRREGARERSVVAYGGGPRAIDEGADRRLQASVADEFLRKTGQVVTLPPRKSKFSSSAANGRPK